MSRQKQKGTLAETQLTAYLQDNGIIAFRNPLSGAKDKGDITILGDHKIILEVKNHRTMDLSTWVDEAVVEKANAQADFAAVAHKRLRKGSPGQWYLTMTIDEFISLIKALK